MTLEDAIAKHTYLDAAVTLASQHLKAFDRFRKPPLNLLPEDVRTSPEYQRRQRDFTRDFQALRAFNAWYVKAFKTELRAKRNARRPA